jgi:hypothetical protein
MVADHPGSQHQGGVTAAGRTRDHDRDDQWEAERIAQIEQRFTQWLASWRTPKAKAASSSRGSGLQHGKAFVWLRDEGGVRG